MALRKPLVRINGRPKELPNADSLDGVFAIAWPRRNVNPKIAGAWACSTLATLVLTAARQYFFPFCVPKETTLTSLRISVSTALAGTASVGIYANQVVSGDDQPGALLASVTGLDTGTTGDKTGAVSLTLVPGKIYWASVIGSAGATIRALAVANIFQSLGWAVGGTAANTHYFVAGSGSTMPANAATSLSVGVGSVPAIYLVGS